MEVLESDLTCAINTVIESLCGIDKLYDRQITILRHLVNKNNIFFTSATNSGKTLPPVILPRIMKELNKLGYSYPEDPKVLFITALNSLQASLASSLALLGLECGVVTRSNVEQILSSGVGVLLVGPEVLKHPIVVKSLMNHRSTFVCKVIDEAHLGILIYSES